MTVAGVGELGDARSRVDGELDPHYSRWHGMLHRCHNEDCRAYNDYGGRGITVCERWLTFANYEQDVKELEGYNDPAKTTIDRIDNDGPYSPDNCRWASRGQQIDNQRLRVDQKVFVGLHPCGGLKVIAVNQAAIARVFGLTQGNISNCLNGRIKSHKGWKFQPLHRETK